MAPTSVGGQAVIEGVMMRSPRHFAVVCRTPQGSLVVRRRPWTPLAESWKFLRWPFFRGILMLGETLHNGMSALAFSAEVQEQHDPELASKAKNNAKPASQTPLWITFAFAIAVAFGMFAALPHFLTLALGWALDSESLSGGRSLAFQAVDGVIKLAIFIGYLALISLMPDIRRVFQYHGAEHKSIHTFEHGQDLTVANARTHTTLHPRCGTSFLLVVVLVAILVFSTLFPFIPQISEKGWLNQIFFVVVKMFLLFPIGGVAYEFIKLSARHPNNALLGILVKPGLWTQRITTKEPDDSQLEVALASLMASLKAEERIASGQTAVTDAQPATFASFSEFVQHLEEPHVSETA